MCQNDRYSVQKVQLINKRYDPNSALQWEIFRIN